MIIQSLKDNLSYLWSWHWPEAKGEVTDTDIDRIEDGEISSYRLVVMYKFSVGVDGPYTGLSYWAPLQSEEYGEYLRSSFPSGKQVTVRYRRDDPSLNRLDRSEWQGL